VLKDVVVRRLVEIQDLLAVQQIAVNQTQNQRCKRLFLAGIEHAFGTRTRDEAARVELQGLGVLQPMEPAQEVAIRHKSHSATILLSHDVMSSARAFPTNSADCYR
jgi:hypothetical protein